MGRGLLGLSLEIGSSGLLASQRLEASWDGAECLAPPHHGGCNCMSPSAIASSGDVASLAPRNCLESLDGGGVIRQGEA